MVLKYILYYKKRHCPLNKTDQHWHLNVVSCDHALNCSVDVVSFGVNNNNNNWVQANTNWVF